jgi:hypothetical protein
MSKTDKPSARERVAAKKRRRFVFPLELSDPTVAQRRVDEARQKVMLQAAVGKEGPDRDKLVEDLAAAEKELAEHYEPIEFQNARPSDYEALSAAHFKDKPDSEIDIDSVLPALAAICAVAKEFSDEEYWVDQLNPETTSWSIGERGDLYGRLIDVNVARPDVRIPKG